MEEKRGIGYDIFLTLALSAGTVLMTRTHFEGGVWGKIEQNYISSFGLSAVLLFLVCVPVYYMLVSRTDRLLYRWLKKAPLQEKQESDRKTLLFWALLLIAAWLPYFLSYYPGGVYSDTFASINFIRSGTRTTQQPFLYTCLIQLLIWFGRLVGQDLTWSLGLLLALQMLILGAELLYFLHWMCRRRFPAALRNVIMAFLVFYPLIPLNGISVWKDTPFCMAVMLWMIALTDLYVNMRCGRWERRPFILFVIGMLLTAFTRNNGLYTIAFSAALFVIVSFRQPLFRKKTVCTGMLLAVFAAALIQGPVYRLAGIAHPPAAAKLGIPLQQIGSVVAYDGAITEEQKELLDRFIPYENIREHYSPCLADDLKWYADLDTQYLAEHQDEFWKLWLALLVKNPSLYVKAYLLETAGFWNIDVASNDAYVQTYVWPNRYGVVQTDYFQKWFGFSFQHFVTPRSYISGAWFFWIFLCALFFVTKHYGLRKSWLFSPQMGVWLTLMIATPIASSLRYIAPLLFTLPFILLLPVLLEREAREAKEKKQS